MNEVLYVLLEDTDLTMRSSMEPSGYAVLSEADADLWMRSSRYRSYRKIRVMDSIVSVAEAIHADAEDRRRKLLGMVDLSVQIRSDKEQRELAAKVAEQGGPLPCRSPEEIDQMFAEIPPGQLDEPTLSPVLEWIVNEKLAAAIPKEDQ